MAIDLPPELRKRLEASLRRYVAEELDVEMGDLKSALFLDFVLRELAPTVYNRAIADAQAYFQDRVADLEGVCHEEEFGYWPPARRTTR